MTSDGTISSERTTISTEERRHLLVNTLAALHEKGIADVSLVALLTAIDGTLEKLGVKISDDVYTNDGTEDADGTTVCRHCGGKGVEYLTEDERQFFAYMAAQRWRTVAEKDTALRDQKRERWQAVAVWFDPNWKPE